MSKKKILCDLSPAERRRVEILTAQLGDLTPDEMHLFLIGMDRQVQKLKKTREIKSKLDLNDFNLFENYGRMG